MICSCWGSQIFVKSKQSLRTLFKLLNIFKPYKVWTSRAAVYC